MKKYNLEIAFQPEYTEAELDGLTFTMTDELQAEIDKAVDFLKANPKMQSVDVQCEPPDNWEEVNPDNRIGVSNIQVYYYKFTDSVSIYLYMQEKWDAHQQYEFNLIKEEA